MPVCKLFCENLSGSAHSSYHGRRQRLTQHIQVATLLLEEQLELKSTKVKHRTVLQTMTQILASNSDGVGSGSLKRDILPEILTASRIAPPFMLHCKWPLDPTAFGVLGQVAAILRRTSYLELAEDLTAIRTLL